MGVVLLEPPCATTQQTHENQRTSDATRLNDAFLPAHLFDMDACAGMTAQSRDPSHIPFPIPQGEDPNNLILAEEGIVTRPGASFPGRISEEKPEVSSEDVDQPDVGPGSALDMYLEQRKGELIV